MERTYEWDETLGKKKYYAITYLIMFLSKLGVTTCENVGFAYGHTDFGKHEKYSITFYE
jgi:hypothetical protein